MARIPGPEAVKRVRTGLLRPPDLRQSVTEAGQLGAGIAKAGLRLTELGLQRREKLQQASDNAFEAAERTGAAVDAETLRRKYEETEDLSDPTVFQRFTQELTERNRTRQETLQQKYNPSDNVVAAYAGAEGQPGITERLQLKTATQFWAASNTAVGLKAIDTFNESISALEIRVQRGDVTFDDAVLELTNLMALADPALKTGDRIKVKSAALTGLGRAVIDGMIERNPWEAERFLNTAAPEELARLHLDAADIGTLTRKAEVAQRSRQAEADRRDTLSASEIKKRADDLAKVGWDLHDKGQLTSAWVRKHLIELSKPDGRALFQAARGLTEPQDTREAIEDLNNILGEPEFPDRVSRYLQEGRITLPTYQSLMDKHRRMIAADAPPNKYKAGHDLIRQSLDPGLLSGTAATFQRLARADAIEEWNTWFAQNPNATYAEAITEATAIGDRHQSIEMEKVSLSIGLPRFYKGTRDAITLEDIDDAEARAVEEHKAGRLSDAQMVLEMKKLNDWRLVLGAKK